MNAAKHNFLLKGYFDSQKRKADKKKQDEMKLKQKQSTKKIENKLVGYTMNL